MIAEHYAALRTRLDAHPGLSGKGNDTAKVNLDGSYIRANYWILFGGAPSKVGGDRQARSQIVNDNAVFDYIFRAVGISPEAVRGMIDAGMGQLVEWRPVIPGRRCQPVRYTGGTDLQKEPAVSPPLYYQDAEFELRSNFVNAA